MNSNEILGVSGGIGRSFGRVGTVLTHNGQLHQILKNLGTEKTVEDIKSYG